MLKERVSVGHPGRDLNRIAFLDISLARDRGDFPLPPGFSLQRGELRWLLWLKALSQRTLPRRAAALRDYRAAMLIN